ncbi:MAG: rRNA maturation RNase YbeY [Candidatus Parcubacteria bacterium]|nr:rRNA maturation RNase YbeY [Candidatus Parcubacteria bacterium]
MELNFFDFSKEKTLSSLYLKNRLNIIFSALKEKKSVSLSIILITEKAIKNYNDIWRQKDEATTILTFCDERENVLSWRGKDLKEKHLGDIFLCPKQIKKKAKEYKIAYDKYLDSILIHGVLHLYGYSHEKESQTKKMEQKEKNILENISKRQLH